MTELTSSELHHDSDLVAVSEKTQRMVYFRIKVIHVDMTGELNLLSLDNLLLFTSFLFLFITLEAELSIIHNSAHRRFSLRCDENKIKSPVISHILCCRKGDNTKLLAV